MKKFLIVVHSWFGSSSRGWTITQVDAETKEDAEKEAILISHDIRDTFTEVEFNVIELEEGFSMPNRKLTWMERIMGEVAR